MNIAESVMFGALIHCWLYFCSGFKLTLASYPALQNSGNYGIQNFIDRMTRYQDYCRPTTIVFELLR